MPYVDRSTFLNVYTLSDVVLINNASEASTTSGLYTLLKEITIKERIYPQSNFRIKFDLKTEDVTSAAHGRLYLNGSPLTAAHSTASLTYVTFTEDIYSPGAWNINDKLQLYLYSNDGVHHAYCQNFQVCGARGPMVNTVGM